MRNKKSIIAAALIAPTLALGGGIAYASTTSGSTPAPARPTVTSAVHPKSQNPAGTYRCDWRAGNHHCDWRGHGNQQQATQQRSHHNGYQGRSGYGSGGYGGNWGSQGSGQHGHGSRWGNGDCGGGWR